MVRVLLLGLILVKLSIGQEVSTITGVSLDSKKNGLFIKFHTDIPISAERITGWYNQSGGWFYTTILLANADTSHIENTKFSHPVSQIECSIVGESVQIGFRVITPIEQFEFYHSEEPTEILASLRYPLSEMITELNKSENPSIAIPVKPFENPRRKAIIQTLYFAGGGLTTAGFLSKEKSSGWEIPMGMGFIAAAYIIETFFQGDKS